MSFNIIAKVLFIVVIVNVNSIICDIDDDHLIFAHVVRIIY